MRVERRIRAVGTGVRAALAVTFALSVLVAHGNAGAAPGDPEPAATAGASTEATATPAPSEATPPTAEVSANAAVSTTPAPASASAEPSAPEAAGSPMPDSHSEQKNGFRAAPRDKNLEWGGGLDLDPGYVRYSFDSVSIAPERYYDVRGRFVVGPTLLHDMDNGWFLKARAEGVLWVRETSTYQINADDVYGQVGQHGKWDFKLGRFTTWRVYHKGLGFDLYTLEDNGACQKGGCDPSSPGQFAPHTYEVSDIYYREPAGHAAFHVYPTPWLAAEASAVYGNTPVLNVLGTRGALVAHFPFLRVSGAAEYRSQYPSKKQVSVDSSGKTTECDKCGGVTTSYGFGGGAELTLAPIEVGVNAATRKGTSYVLLSGAPDRAASTTTTSIGGYVELDAGTLAFKRSMIVGVGLNRTEVLDQVSDFLQHTQAAVYVAYPLGFHDASVKLVISEAKSHTDQASKDPSMPVQSTNSQMVAGRVRFSYPF